VKQRKTQRLVLVVQCTSDPNALTLVELQQGEGVGCLVPMFKAFMCREQKETPEPVEVESLQGQAS
jgi:hypothetical protein